MASATIKPAYTAAQKAWISAYCTSHGPIVLSAGAHAATIAADGSIVLADAPVVVVETMMVGPSAELQAAVKTSAPGWIDGMIARGFA